MYEQWQMLITGGVGAWFNISMILKYFLYMDHLDTSMLNDAVRPKVPKFGIIGTDEGETSFDTSCMLCCIHLWFQGACV